MSIVIDDPALGERLLAERQASGGDRYDEVWDGVYIMSPLANDEHQELAHLLGVVYTLALGWGSPHKVYTAVNVSDREEGWEHNYRCPDNAVFLEGNPAKECGTHRCGGPDFLNEILSKGDRGRDKLPFYEKLGVREVLIVDRYPWALELYRLQEGQLRLAGRATPDDGVVLSSEVLPLKFRLLGGPHRPVIEVLHVDGVQKWRV